MYREWRWRGEILPSCTCHNIHAALLNLFFAVKFFEYVLLLNCARVKWKMYVFPCRYHGEWCTPVSCVHRDASSSRDSICTRDDDGDELLFGCVCVCVCRLYSHGFGIGYGNTQPNMVTFYLSNAIEHFKSLYFYAIR